MPVLMMHVGHMRMRVHQISVRVLMHMRFTRWILGTMCMLMMFIMRVSVRMSCWRMAVDVLVTLRNVKPYTEAHQNTGDNQWRGNWLTKSKNCYGCSEEGCG
jgi:hypothetical protein